MYLRTTTNYSPNAGDLHNAKKIPPFEYLLLAIWINFTQQMKCNNHIQSVQYCIRCMAILAICFLLPALSFGQRYPFHNLSVDDGLIQSQAMCMSQDKTGNLWIGTLGGLSRYDGRNFTNYTVRNGLLNNVVQSVAVDSSGSIWIGGNSGLSQFNGKTFIHYHKPRQETRPTNSSQQLLEDLKYENEKLRDQMEQISAN